MLHYLQIPAGFVCSAARPGRLHQARAWPRVARRMPADPSGQRVRIRPAGKFRRHLRSNRGRWRVAKDVTIESDFEYSAARAVQRPAAGAAICLVLGKGTKLPHPISDNVYAQINNQVKISSFLFLKTDQNELLLMTDVPNLESPVSRDVGHRGHRLVSGQLSLAHGRRAGSAAKNASPFARAIRFAG